MQNKLKHITGIAIVFVFLMQSVSCGYGDRAHKRVTEKAWNGYTKATVVNYTYDGCSWMLELEDGKKLQPSALKPEFQKEKLKVWIRYEPKKGGMGICMAGELVNITEIELRKND
ncbi:MAG: hypothetical protein JWO44_1702 [Bacteroidetes bacterium]|nr:hypothetical protein [Bacteroidota bacterium]